MSFYLSFGLVVVLALYVTPGATDDGKLADVMQERADKLSTLLQGVEGLGLSDQINGGKTKIEKFYLNYANNLINIWFN